MIWCVQAILPPCQNDNYTTKVLNKIKIAVRISSRRGVYKYDESMINV